MDILIRIKRLVIRGRVVFTEKADFERMIDGLSPEMIYEAILNAPAVYKKIRSRDPKTKQTEYLYVIKGMTFDGLSIYTKGKIRNENGLEVFYVLISSKRSTD